MKFGINKCATMIIRSKNFDSNGSPDPTFYIDNHPLPKTSCYTYLGIPFPNTLNLKPIISILNDKLNRSMNSHYILLSNKHIPLHIKKYILIYFVLALVNYFAPLLGSNKSNTSKAQTIINNGIYRCLGFKGKNTSISLFSATKELSIPPLSARCAVAQRKCFNKWKKSSCVIGLLINNIPTIKDFYTWTKESRTLDSKLLRKGVTKKLIFNHYWKDLIRSSKANNYIKYKYDHFNYIRELNLKHPKYHLGFLWILRIRCGFKFNSIIARRSKLVSDNCPNYCPCSML